MDISKQLENLYFIADTATETKLADFENDIIPEMAFINSKPDKSTKFGSRVSFNCEVQGEGITDSEYGHSIFCKISDDATLAAFNILQDRATDITPEGIEFNPFLKNDSVFIKLAQKDGKYKAAIIPTCTPATFEKSAVEYGSKIEVSCSVNMYINFKDKKAGIYLTINRLVIDGGKKKRK